VTIKETGYILGLAYFGNHEASAALLKNGKLIAMAEEATFTSIRSDRTFPMQAIAHCLAEANITIHHIDQVGFFWQPWRGVITRISYALKGLPHSLSRGAKNTGVLFDLLRAERVFRRKTGYRGSFEYLEHPLCHAASTFFTSGFERAAILSVDGTGEVDSCWLGAFDGKELIKYRSTRWPHSLGHFYATATDYLGFTRFADERLVMELSTQGSPILLKAFRNIMTVTDKGEFRLDLNYTRYQYFHERWYSDLWVRNFGPARKPDEPIQEHHKNIAASIQTRLEEILLELATYAIKKSGFTSLCIAGGVAQNSLAIEALKQSGITEHIHVPSLPGDAGTALGAAYLIYHRTLTQER
jgi:carbamoyltransferase